MSGYSLVWSISIKLCDYEQKIAMISSQVIKYVHIHLG